MKKLLLVPFLLLTVSFPSSAEGTRAESEAMGFLRYERNPERVAMAGAGWALTGGGSAFSAFGSPALGVKSTKRLEVGGSYATWAPSISGTTNITLGANCLIAGGLSLSGGYVTESFKEIPLGDGTSYAPSNSIIAAAASLALSPSLSLGGSVNFSKMQLLEDYSVSGTSVDIQLNYKISGFSISSGARCLGGTVSESPLPSSAVIALGYEKTTGSVDVALAADADYYYLSGNWSAAAGVKATFLKIANLCAGYRFSSPGAVIPSHLALGAGLSLGGIKVTASWIGLSENLDGSIVFGLSAGF